MNRIFISGSRHVKMIPQDVLKRINNIILNNDEIIIGDATGVDKLVQKYLLSYDYKKVIVFCSGEKCRNNLGNWKEYCVNVPQNIKGFQFYALKDKKMAFNATHGLMIWDGKSFGTVLNVLRMTILKKVSVLFDAKNCNTFTFRDENDLIQFYNKFDNKMLNSIYDRASKEEISYLKSLTDNIFIQRAVKPLPSGGGYKAHR